MRKVHDVDVAPEHRCIGYQSTVASPVDRLRAHDRRASPGSLLQHLVEGIPERRTSHVVCVAAKRFVAQRCVRRTRKRFAPATEPRFPAVSDPRLRNPAFHRLAGEVRVPAGTRSGSHIDQQFEISAPDKIGELLLRQRAVPEGQQFDTDHLLNPARQPMPRPAPGRRSSGNPILRTPPGRRHDQLRPRGGCGFANTRSLRLPTRRPRR